VRWLKERHWSEPFSIDEITTPNGKKYSYEFELEKAAKNQ